MREPNEDEYIVRIGNKTMIIHRPTGRKVEVHAHEFERKHYRKVTKNGKTYWTAEGEDSE